MTLGEGAGIIGLLRSMLNDRPKVKILASLYDYGEPPSYVITTRVGLQAQVAVHSTGAQPVHIRDVVLEFGDSQVVLGHINKTLTRPDFEVAYGAVSTIRERAGTQLLTGIHVTATPDRVFRIKPPKGWERFPSELPPVGRGR